MFVAGGATIVSFLVLLTMVKTKIGEFKGNCTFFFGVQCVMLIFMQGGFQIWCVRLFLVSHCSKVWVSKIYNLNAYLEKLRTL